MYKFLLTGLSLIFFGESFCLQAQPVWQSWNTANSDLPDNSVRALATDGQGNLWIGTENGLAKFNGTAFTLYTSANSALPDNSIRALATYGNQVWVGTFSGGLCLLEDNSWTVYNTSNSSLPENQIRALAIGPQGEKWIGTTGGMAKLHGNNWTIWNMTNSGFTSNNITAIALAHNGSRYLATINGGLLHQTDSSLQVFNYMNSSLPDNSAVSLAFAPSGELLIGTTTAGLVAHHSDSVFTSFSPANSGNLTYSVTAVATDSLNNWFLGSELAGLVQQQSGNWQNYTAQNSGIPANYVQALLAKQTGEIWIGMQTGGLARLSYLPLSVEAQSYAAADFLYPNPANSATVIRFGRVFGYPCVSVQNNTGRLVFEKKYSGMVSHLENLNLLPGSYLVSVTTSQGIFRQRLLIQ